MAVDYLGYVPPAVSPTMVPALPLLGLSESERDLVARLQSQSRPRVSHQLLCDAYYNGSQVIDNLGIAIPDKIATLLRTLVGWPRKAVDPYVYRLAIDGFRVAGATDANDDLADLWAANGLDSEQALAFTDALVMGSAYLVVGSGDSPSDPPLITVESPVNMSVLWSARTRKPEAVLQQYRDESIQKAALLLNGQTISLAVDDAGAWQVTNRDVHGFDIPVHRMANRPRSGNRDGFSEITPSVMSITDAACRTLLGLEVAREFYSVPKMVLLGAVESDFQNSDGTPKSAWDAYVNRLLALERDDDGNLPDLKQLTPYDPGVFTRLVEMYASQMAGELDATPQEFGLYTQGNPTSAEAAAVNQANRDRTAVFMQRTFSTPWIRAMQDGLRFQNAGRLPAEFERLSADWADVAIKTPGVTSDAITKQIAAGAVPPRSDVTLKRLGYSAVERARLEQDWREQNARTALQQIADGITANASKPTPPTPTTVTPDGNANAG